MDICKRLLRDVREGMTGEAHYRLLRRILRRQANQAAVAEVRKEVEWFHPTPDLLESAGYLATEAGEVLDAVLRIRRDGDDRTHERRRNLGREIGQVLYMAYTTAMVAGIDADEELRKWLDELRRRGEERK